MASCGNGWFPVCATAKGSIPMLASSSAAEALMMGFMVSVSSRESRECDCGRPLSPVLDGGKDPRPEKRMQQSGDKTFRIFPK
jgi:hypothetical protein